ncbi:GMC family oxidoreductase N-terminal domain-containing protein [Curtobacterium flaccumfaciens]|nr:GMC family oxidoreductase N-terminal domain-containing protein [Curtobacterium flaccumfaciens]
MPTPEIATPSRTETVHDYVVVGGGTAGSLLAARLSEDPDVSVALLEWGPDDRNENRARYLRRWAEMLEGTYDLDYRCVPQERGNSGIRQARMRILGGCSNANTMITWRPLASDLREWAALGASGWEPETILPYYDRIEVPIHPVGVADRNPFVAEVVAAAAVALDVPIVDAWNDGRLDERAAGSGFFEVGYDPETNVRGATSIHYLHPVMDHRQNLTVVTGVRATRVLVEDGRAVGVEVADAAGRRSVTARREVVLCAGAIDTPRLLQLSGIGPRDVLKAAGVDLVVELPGVGENLQDHAEGLAVWEVADTTPTTSASGWDAGAMFSLGGDPTQPDVLMHFPVEPVVDHPRALGVAFPERIAAIAPNVAKPASRGRVWIESTDVNAPPLIDYRYFTDPDGHDERVLVEGVRAARRIAKAAPLSAHVLREVFPGPEVQSDDALGAALRAVHQTVYHVSGTCRMGAADDPLAVTDPQLRVRGLDGLRIVDASVFPTVTAVNPVGTVMTVAERAADLIRRGD